MEAHYKVGELRKVVRESANEFKPVFGKNVPEDNKKINKDAYNDIEKETKNYDGGLTEKKTKGEAPTTETNYGMSDIAYDSITKPFSDKVRSQIKGYASAEAEKEHKNDEFGNATFGDDKPFVDKAKENKKERDDVRKSWFGTHPSKGSDQKTIGENKVKRITFKRTQFISEDHMVSMIPDEYKSEGNKFVMKDNVGNAYMVEWVNGNAKSTKMLNEEKINKELNRINELFGYKTKEYFNGTTSKSRLAEEKNFGDMLDKVRKLM